MNEIKNLVEQLIELTGIHGASVVPIRYALFFIIAIFLSWFSGWAGWYIIRPIIQKISSKTPTEWDTLLFNDTVLRTFCKLIPAIVIWKLLPLVVFQHATLKDIVTRLTAVYICVMVVKLLLAIIKSVETKKTKKGSNMQLYAKSFLGVVRIVIFFLAAIVIVATLLNKNPLTLLAGLGATSAVLMLVFQDTIQGLVAGIRLNSNEMVRIGDWITVPGTPADGIVEDVTLTTVKVRNFDNTTATVTPMALVNGSFQNGTGVGSETASEHEMFRKFMIDSLLYWVEEFNVDGFRFDLMGIHDVETMNVIRQAMDEVDPRILLYGEGWDMGTGLAPYDKAKKDNAYEMPNIGFFNDNQRDAVKGGEVYGAIKSGFVSGAATEPILAKAILGSRELGTYTHPNQVLNYVEAHDNYNLHDLLATLHPDQSSEQIMRKVETATAMNLLMQGMAFMEIGQEFGRTKLVATGENGELTHDDRERAMNSYNAPDSVNQVNWDLINERQDSIEFIRQMIRLKTGTGAFSYPTYDEIYHHVFVHSANEHSGLIVYEIQGEDHLLVVFNAKGQDFQFENAGNLELLVTNSHLSDKDMVGGVSTSVFKVL